VSKIGLMVGVAMIADNLVKTQEWYPRCGKNIEHELKQIVRCDCSGLGATGQEGKKRGTGKTRKAANIHIRNGGLMGHRGGRAGQAGGG